MVDLLRDKINYHKVSKYANVLIFKEFYPKTKNVSYYLKDWSVQGCNKAKHKTYSPIDDRLVNDHNDDVEGVSLFSSPTRWNSL